MVRKRYWYNRTRAKRPRPKTPAPRDGFLIADVARLTDVPVRTLRDYVRRGLLCYSEARGRITRYPRVEVRRLLVALRLRAQKRAPWAAIKAELRAFDDARLEAWLAAQQLAPAVAAELGIVSVENVGATSLDSQPDASTGGGERWQRTELLPGLELFLRDGASPAVRNAARRIVEEHVGT
jgi:DNA-binding transcriptional MerR regulator